jgi:hypothetical protein
MGTGWAHPTTHRIAEGATFPAFCAKMAAFEAESAIMVKGAGDSDRIAPGRRIRPRTCGSAQNVAPAFTM